MKNIQTNKEKLTNAIKLSFPFIQFQTMEHSRIENVSQKSAMETGKLFINMPYKASPNKEAIEYVIKETIKQAQNSSDRQIKSIANNLKGFVIHDKYFFDREKGYPVKSVAAIKGILNYLEANGINYIVSGKDKVNEEFVYNIDLDPLSEEEMEELYQFVTESFKDAGYDIKLDKKEKETLFNYARGLTYMQIKNLFTMALYLKKEGKDYIEELKKEKKNLLQEYGLDVLDTIPLEQVGGLENLKEFMVIRKVGWDKGLPLKGILLRGVPGTGKTHAAKAIAGILNTPLVQMSFQNFYNKYVGESETKLRKALNIIEEIAPVTVLIDEIEKVFSNSGSSESSGVTNRMLGTFLTWLEERKGKIFVVATANREMPPELTRIGRWDRQFFVDLPNEIERKEIFKVHLKINNIPESVIKDWNRLIEKTTGFTGGEIKQAVIDAKHLAAYRNTDITQEIIEEAIKDIRPLFETNREQIEEIRKLKDKGFYPANKGASIDNEYSSNLNDENKSRKIF